MRATRKKQQALLNSGAGQRGIESFFKLKEPAVEETSLSRFSASRHSVGAPSLPANDSAPSAPCQGNRSASVVGTPTTFAPSLSDPDYSDLDEYESDVDGASLLSNGRASVVGIPTTFAPSLSDPDYSDLDEYESDVDGASPLTTAFALSSSDCDDSDLDEYESGVDGASPLGNRRASVVGTPTAFAPKSSGPTNRKDWTEPTWLDKTSAKSSRLLTDALEFFNQPRTEGDVVKFLQSVPEHSGWIHPLVQNFRRHRGKSALLTILMCPKQHQRMDFDAPLPDKHAYTHALLLPIGDMVKAITGMPTINIDFRKECRRKGDHCAFFRDTEFPLLAVATQVELLIARNVYDITFQQTTTWSRDVSAKAKGLDHLLSLEPKLTGTVDRISFHPRQFAQYKVETQFAQSTFWHGMHDYVFPILSTVTGLTLDDIHSKLERAWSQSPNVQLKTVVVSAETKAFSIASLPDILATPDDMSKKTVNTAMLAAFATLANSPHAELFAKKGMLPTWYLHQPRMLSGPPRSRRKRVLEDVHDAPSVDGERGVIPSSPDPSTEATAHSGMIPNPIFDANFILSAPATVILQYCTGLVGSETLASRKAKIDLRNRIRGARSESQREEDKRRQLVWYANYKERLNTVPGMRERVNEERRQRRRHARATVTKPQTEEQKLKKKAANAAYRKKVQKDEQKRERVNALRRERRKKLKQLKEKKTGA